MREESMRERLVLDVRDLCIALPEGGDRVDAVSGVSLQVKRGEIVCLIGESGSGKSMIGFSAMGLLPEGVRITGGSITLGQEDITRACEARMRSLRCRQAGMIFQEPMTALNPVMRCADQIDEVLLTHTTLDAGQRRQCIRDMLAQVGLPDVERIARSYPHQLSGGQRQRIMIAMTLILEPALLIADEPTTALDVTTQAQILQLVRDLQRERGTGVLFITHDFGVVSEIADRVLVLQHGKLVESGTAEEVLRNPQHPYTRMLIAAVPGYQPISRQRAADAPVLLKVSNLSKHYGGGWLQRRQAVVAAHDVSLQLRRGETLGVVGESGSGKSTLARCVARLIEPSAGRIYLDQDEIGHLSESALHPLRPRVQIIFQDPYRSLNPRRDIRSALVEGPMNYGVGCAEATRRALELLELVRMDADALGRYPHQFSGGQRQRLCIARALAMQPQLLIADEAVSALDVSVQAQVLALLTDIRDRFHLAMLFITHDLRVAAALCDDVAVMRAGEIVEIGPADRVFTRPEHPYSRALFEAAPGNPFRHKSPPP